MASNQVCLVDADWLLTIRWREKPRHLSSPTGPMSEAGFSSATLSWARRARQTLISESQPCHATRRAPSAALGNRHIIRIRASEVYKVKLHNPMYNKGWMNWIILSLRNSSEINNRKTLPGLNSPERGLQVEWCCQECFSCWVSLLGHACSI